MEKQHDPIQCYNHSCWKDQAGNYHVLCSPLFDGNCFTCPLTPEECITWSGGTPQGMIYDLTDLSSMTQLFLYAENEFENGNSTGTNTIAIQVIGEIGLRYYKVDWYRTPNGDREMKWDKI